MSRRSLESLKQNRIDNLFEDLEIDGHDFIASQEVNPQGWTWECDTEGNYLACSPEVEKVFKMPARVFLGKPVARFLVKKESQAALEQAFKYGHHPVDVDIQHLLLDGRSLQARLCILKPHQSENNGNDLIFSGFTTIVQDDRQPSSSESQVEYPNAPKFRFLTGIGMELRAAVNSLLGYSRVMLKDVDASLSELAKQDLRAIYEAGRRMLLLADELVDFSRIESGAIELNFEENVNMEAIIASLANSTKGYFRDQRIALVTDIAPHLPPLRVDPIKMRKILSQLLSLAAQTTRSGTITLAAQFGLNERAGIGDSVQVSVSGIYCLPAEVNNLINPFDHSDDLAAKNIAMGDFGLYTTKKLIELHGGQLEVYSDADESSKIGFTLPVNKPHSRYTKSSKFALPTNQASRQV